METGGTGRRRRAVARVGPAAATRWLELGDVVDGAFAVGRGDGVGLVLAYVEGDLSSCCDDSDGTCHVEEDVVSQEGSVSSVGPWHNYDMVVK